MHLPFDTIQHYKKGKNNLVSCRCHFVSFVMHVSDAKLKNTASIFQEKFSIRYFAFLLLHMLTARLTPVKPSPAEKIFLKFNE